MSNIIKKFLKDFDSITEYYNFLVDKTKKHQYIEITNEWIVDNYYLLVEHKNNILESKKELLKDKKIFKINYDILKDIAVRHNYNISFKILVEELKLYQKNKNKVFTYKELNLVIPTLLFIYCDRLNKLCKIEYNNLKDKQNISNTIKENDMVSFSNFLKDGIDLNRNKHYIFEINNQLNKVGNNSEIFKDLNKYLEKNNIILKDLLKEEYQNKFYLGRGGWTWYTGSSGWFYKIGIENILGLKKEKNILKIEPNIPSYWNNYNINYKYFNTNYSIEVIRDSKNEIIVDNIVSPNTIKLIDDGKEHIIVVHIS